MSSVIIIIIITNIIVIIFTIDIVYFKIPTTCFIENKII